jgi:hypothetical protein
MFNADWTKCYRNADAVETDLNLDAEEIDFSHQGWHESPTDTLFVQPLDDGRIMLYCWNRPDARAELCRLIGLPVSRIGDWAVANVG